MGSFEQELVPPLEFERDDAAYVVAMSKDAARAFFGVGPDVKVEDRGPPPPDRNCKPGARSFAVFLPSDVDQEEQRND